MTRRDPPATRAGEAPAATVRPPAPAWWAAGLLVTPVLRAAVGYHAVPAGAAWRRACDRCTTPLAYPWRTGAFLPTARCGTCGARVGAPPFAVEIAAVAAAAAVVIGWRGPWFGVAAAWWAAFAVVLAFVDVAVHRLPDRLTLPAAAGVYAALGAAALVTGDGAALRRAVIAGLGPALVFAAMTLALGRRGPGLGDAKLLLSVGALLGWLGWPAVVAGLLLAFLGQGLLAAALLIARRADRRTMLPLGPFLVAGTLAAIALPG